MLSVIREIPVWLYWSMMGAVVFIGWWFLWRMGSYFLYDNVSVRAADRFDLTFGLPFMLIFIGEEAVVEVLTAPWNWVQRARFHGIFGFWPDGDGKQRMVIATLTELAYDMEVSFQEQEGARRFVTEGNFIDLAKPDERVRLAKRSFWRAHGLADRFGFEVSRSFRKYVR